MKNIILVDLKKSIFCYGFVLCIVLTSFLCFTSIIYIDSMSGKEYSVIEIIINRENFKHLQFDSCQILHSSVNPYITMFLPVLSSIPFVICFCTERISTNIRFSIIRSGKYIYCISKFISAIISAGSCVMLGFILYSFIICFLFPNDKSNILELIKLYIGMGVYGASSVVPAFFISSFIKNKYMICSFPFVFMHFYYTTLSKIQDVLIENGKMEIVIKLSFLYPNELKEILFHKDIKMMLFYFIISVCSFIGFTLLMNRRIDYGQ